MSRILRELVVDLSIAAVALHAINTSGVIDGIKKNHPDFGYGVAKVEAVTTKIGDAAVQIVARGARTIVRVATAPKAREGAARRAATPN